MVNLQGSKDIEAYRLHAAYTVPIPIIYAKVLSPTKGTCQRGNLSQKVNSIPPPQISPTAMSSESIVYGLSAGHPVGIRTASGLVHGKYVSLGMQSVIHSLTIISNMMINRIKVCIDVDTASVDVTAAKHLLFHLPRHLVQLMIQHTLQPI